MIRIPQLLFNPADLEKLRGCHSVDVGSSNIVLLNSKECQADSLLSTSRVPVLVDLGGITDQTVCSFLELPKGGLLTDNKALALQAAVSSSIAVAPLSGWQLESRQISKADPPLVLLSVDQNHASSSVKSLVSICKGKAASFVSDRQAARQILQKVGFAEATSFSSIILLDDFGISAEEFYIFQCPMLSLIPQRSHLYLPQVVQNEDTFEDLTTFVLDLEKDYYLKWWSDISMSNLQKLLREGVERFSRLILT
jgi:hypothetical protein